jgi:hypothetical protein
MSGMSPLQRTIRLQAMVTYEELKVSRGLALRQSPADAPGSGREINAQGNGRCRWPGGDSSMMPVGLGVGERAEDDLET